MSNISAEQQALLMTLIYFDDVADQDGMTVEQIINNIRKFNGIESYKNKQNEFPGCMNHAEWEDCFNRIMADPELKKMRVQDSSEMAGGYPEDFRATSFVSGPIGDPGEVVIVFRGTEGAEQWADDVEGAFVEDTVYQTAALKYVESLPDYPERTHVAITGHSKGGNLATYVTLFSDKIDECIAFDSQGFSNDFIEKYADEIAKNKSKITDINAQNDPVSLLLNPIAGAIKLYGTTDQENLLMYHKPNLLLGKMTEDNLKERTVDCIALKVIVSELTADMEYWPVPTQHLIKSFIIDVMSTKKDWGKIIIELYFLIGALEVAWMMRPYIHQVRIIKFVAKLAVSLALAVKKKIEEGIEKTIKIIGATFSAIEKSIRGFNSWISTSFNQALDTIWHNLEAAMDAYNKAHGSTNSDHIRVDTKNLWEAAQRLEVIQNRIRKINRNMEILNRQNIFDITLLFQRFSSLLDSVMINQSIIYLRNAAETLETCENKILREANQLR